MLYKAHIGFKSTFKVKCKYYQCCLPFLIVFAVRKLNITFLLSEEISQVRSRRTIPEMPVAFTAVKVTDQTNVGINQNILFEQVVLNEGNAFHPHTGVFIAPRSGIYCFHASVMARPQTNPFHAAISHNGVDVVLMHGEGTAYDHSTAIVVIRVQAGEDVWVRNTGYVTGNIVGYLYGSFSGYLLWEA